MPKLSHFYLISLIVLIVCISNISAAYVQLAKQAESISNEKFSKITRISLGQCTAACTSGIFAMESFCRVIPGSTPQILALKAACWGAANALNTPTGITACTNFCYWYFS